MPTVPISVYATLALRRMSRRSDQVYLWCSNLQIVAQNYDIRLQRHLALHSALNEQTLGTNYCGQGNIAENYHDLGVFNETDACCREHDYCDDIIRPGRTKHNLINPFGTTRLHCKCDQALRDCFRKANSVVSNTVGYIFFSVLQTQCFDFDYPASGCLLWRRHLKATNKLYPSISTKSKLTNGNNSSTHLADPDPRSLFEEVGVVVKRVEYQLMCHPRHLTMVNNCVVRRQKSSCS
ncbi:phospholipase A2 [Trichonephila clavipes]|nr:phospholipase A2 [Trichonephila clavipes]